MCLECPIGLWSEGSDRTTCVPCPEGRAGFSGVCTACAAGLYSNVDSITLLNGAPYEMLLETPLAFSSRPNCRKGATMSNICDSSTLLRIAVRVVPFVTQQNPVQAQMRIDLRSSSGMFLSESTGRHAQKLIDLTEDWKVYDLEYVSSLSCLANEARCSAPCQPVVEVDASVKRAFCTFLVQSVVFTLVNSIAQSKLEIGQVHHGAKPLMYAGGVFSHHENTWTWLQHSVQQNPIKVHSDPGTAACSTCATGRWGNTTNMTECVGKLPFSVRLSSSRVIV